MREQLFEKALSPWKQVKTIKTTNMPLVESCEMKDATSNVIMETRLKQGAGLRAEGAGLKPGCAAEC